MRRADTKPVLVLLLAMAAGLGVMYFAMKRIFPHQANLPFNLRRSDPSRDEPWSQTAAPASPLPVPEALPAVSQPAGNPAAPAVTEATAAGQAVPAPPAPDEAPVGDPKGSVPESGVAPARAAGPGASAPAPASRTESEDVSGARRMASEAAPLPPARPPEAAGTTGSPPDRLMPAAGPVPVPGRSPVQGLEPFPAAPPGMALGPAAVNQVIRKALDKLPGYRPPIDSNVITSLPHAQVQNIFTGTIEASADLRAKGAYLAQISGLAPTVALAWVKKENGVNNNILGVTNQNGLETFATWQQGIDAAVNLLQTSNYYAGIRAAIAGGNPCAQRDAIVASPWSGRSHYGNGANFPEIPGCPPYGQ